MRAHVGANEVEHEKPLPWWRHLFNCYRNPFNLLLSALAAVSFATDDTEGTIIIASMVIISSVLRFVQEARSNKAAEKLKAMVSTTATVLRREALGDGGAEPDSVRRLGRMGREIPFVQSRAAWPLLLMTGAVMLIGLMLPMSPFADTFKMQALPLAYFPMLATILLAYAVLTQLMKGMFARRFGWQ